MPEQIKAALSKVMKNFIWDYSILPRIAMEQLHHPIAEGGLNLLDLEARNDAIGIGWLRLYPNLSPERPTWVRITDIIINAAAPTMTYDQVWINMFLQTWNPSMRGKHSKQMNG